MDHREEAARIWRDKVPASGQADTVEGELLRAVEKLRDEAMRNGNANWDDGFDILLTFVEAKLVDPNPYPKKVLADLRWSLARLRDTDDPCLDADLYDRLGDRVVDYQRHYGSQPHAQDPDLYR